LQVAIALQGVDRKGQKEGIFLRSGARKLAGVAAEMRASRGFANNDRVLWINLLQI
jgi:hypothetical protein